MHARCESCGRDDEEVQAVVRLYVEPGAGDADGESPVTTDGDREQWCFVCRTHYAHRLV